MKKTIALLFILIFTVGFGAGKKQRSNKKAVVKKTVVKVAPRPVRSYVVRLLADENGTSANVYFKQDNQEEVLVKELDSVESDIPIDIFPKKKMKKYKRLQIIVENNKNESFGVSEIVKSYTLGNYAK